jgi:hypothetical protein
MLFQRLILFALAAVLISLKADGHFPLPENLSEFTFQLLLFPYTVLFVMTIVFYFKKWRVLPARIIEVNPKFLIQLTASICLLFISLTVFIFLKEGKNYSQFGYHVNRSSLFVLYLISAGLFVYSILKNQSHKRFLFCAIVIFMGFYSFSILSFPIHTGRSDMLPIIQAAGSRFLAGANPYGTYFEPQSVPLTYLPGMWMAYLPAVFMSFDLRIIQLTAIVGSILIIYLATERNNRKMVAALCALFLFTPYLLYRHEVYIGILWLMFALVYLFEQKSKPMWSSFAMGISAAASQFAWVVIPLLLLAIHKRWGRGTAIRGFLCCVTVFSLLVLPFALSSPDAFYSGVFAHWENTLNVTALNFSYFLATIFSSNSLKYFQVFAMGFIYYLALKTSDLPGRMYEYMTYSLLFFILLNPLIWVYFYLVLFLLMIMNAGKTSYQEIKVDTL